jgi:hypothetical protein
MSNALNAQDEAVIDFGPIDEFLGAVEDNDVRRECSLLLELEPAQLRLVCGHLSAIVRGQNAMINYIVRRSVFA